MLASAESIDANGDANALLPRRAGSGEGALVGIRVDHFWLSRAEQRVILASSVGTIFEWYDFFLYGTLVTTIGLKFFGQFDEATRGIFALLTFALGFVVRPLGALLFGRFGDMLGRKTVFLVTIVLMGVSTFAVGLLPTSETAGLWAPIALLVLRLVQGLAVSGEYGGAVVYLCEHAPPGRRGLYAGFVPACIGLSLFFTLLVVLVVQTVLSPAQFDAWGWRVPFIASALLIAFAVAIRAQLDESPAFLKILAEGRRAKAPVSEALGTASNLKRSALALIGMTAGVAATGYTGTFYALVFMTSVLKVDAFTANATFALAMLIGAGACLGFAWVSDKIGRKPVILGGCVLAAFSYFPIFETLAHVANPALAAAQQDVAVAVKADPASCSFLFNPTGAAHFTSPCDTIQSTLSRAGVPYRTDAAPAGARASVTVGERTIEAGPSLSADLTRMLAEAGYPGANDPGILRLSNLSELLAPRALAIVGLLLLLVMFAQMTQGPAAAALVELFPTAIRYTSISLPYQIATGWIGGLLPAILFALNARAGNMFVGLWYPIAIAVMTAVVGAFFLPETRGSDIAS